LAAERSGKGSATHHRAHATVTSKPKTWLIRARAKLGRARFAEIGTLSVFLLLAVMCFGFARLADEVVEGETRAFDDAVMLAMRSADDPSDPIGPEWFEEGVRDITSLGSSTVLVLVSLIVIGFLLMSGAEGAAILVSVSVGGGMLLVHLLKDVFQRSRPDLVPHAVQVFSDSFPSGHATLSAVTYLTLGALLARVERPRAAKMYFLGVAILLTMIVGASRVYLGVHWPTDVLAGWCVGAAWAISCWIVATRLQRRGKVEQQIEN
jgi:undecaprenyl-diphosphatase